MYKRILFATDFDEVSYSAGKRAREIADKISAQLHMVHVIEPFPAYAYPGFAGFTEVEAPLKEHAEQEMDKLAKVLHIPKSNQHLGIGVTKTEVLAAAKELAVDLIIVGSHGKHGLSYLLGSVSNAIVHGATCDVLIVRANM